ncbi:MAG: hypothetical protein QM598_04375, partial [Protaetiibacter sp.]
MRSVRWLACTAGLVLIPLSTPVAVESSVAATPARASAEAAPALALSSLFEGALASDEPTDGPAVDAPVDSGDAQATGGESGTAGGPGGSGRTPGMVGGTFPGNVWAAADVAEVRGAVNAFRAGRGLPALGAPFDVCADRGVVISPGFGIPAGTTHGRLIVAQNGGFLAAAPRDGGVMTAEIWAADVTDLDGVLRPRAIVGVRLYECAMSGPGATAPGTYNPWTPTLPSPAPSPQPSTPPPPAPAPPAP